MTYEIFVDRIIDEDFPLIYAHVLATVDGNKAFLCEFSGLRLIPDWPLLSMPHLIEEDLLDKPIANYKGFKFGYESLINCALGNAVNAFGPEINYYNGVIRSPRLPGPPYHFMTRIQDYKVEPGNYKNKPYVVAEYDIPEGVWYFDENGRATMPYGVLMEVALQPCGWFSTFICQHDIKDKDLVFRNLDGNAIQHRDIFPSDKTIVTRTELTGVSIMGEIIIVKFDVVSTIEGEKVFTMDTVFGFFDTESMKHQKGLARTPEEDANVALENNHVVPLLTFPEAYFGASTASLPASKLLMIDRISAYYPKGGKYGKGYIKAEKDVRKSEWFFKAHFFQDPVQPGSLGIEAMIQLMQFYMLENKLHEKFKNSVFEPISLMDETEWHYRGQVTPEKKLISIDFDVKEIVEEENAVSVIGEARLWVDGLKIYHAPRIGMRIRENTDEHGSKNGGGQDNIPEVIPENLPYNNISLDAVGKGVIGELKERLLNEHWFNFTESVPDFFSDLRSGLTKQFVRNIVFEDYNAIKNLEGKPVMYLANHQTGVESGLFLSLINCISKLKGKAIAKAEHANTWIGQLSEFVNKRYKDNPPSSFITFNRSDPAHLLNVFARIYKDMQLDPFSLLVHVDGTRSEKANEKIKNVSSVLIDFAVKANMNIVPVRFCGGLPLEGDMKLEFPYQFGKQDYRIGTPIPYDKLLGKSLIERVDFIKEKINGLTGTGKDLPTLSDELFQKKVEHNISEYKMPLYLSVIYSVLKVMDGISEETKDFLEGINQLKNNPENVDKYKEVLSRFFKH